ncbi:MAG: class I SAM-dependent methyltransferase [Acidimicrobiales bacterium]
MTNHPGTAVEVDEFALWERHAQWWQDAFTEGADAEYAEQILPLVAAHVVGCRRVLEVGAGEGQVARMVAAAGADLVVAVEPARAQLAAAAARGAGPLLVRGVGGCLPLASASFDAVVACLVFEHIDDTATAIAEVARVLRPGGRFLFLLNHPLLQTPGSGWIDDHILHEQYWRIGAYLTETMTMEEVDQGVKLPFVHRPLSVYVNAMARVGLFIREMAEPAPPPGFLAQADTYRDAASIPRLLFIRAEKL